jgi:MFS family permease
LLSEWLGRLQVESLSGVRNLVAACLASFTYAGGMIGQYIGGRLADRHDLRRLYLGFHAASLPFLLAMAWAHDLLFLVAACGYVFFSLGMQPIENSLVARFTPARWRSTGYGVKFVLSFGVGSSAVYALGALQSGGSFDMVFLVLAGLVVLLCASILLLLYTSRSVAVLNAPDVQPSA